MQRPRLDLDDCQPPEGAAEPCRTHNGKGIEVSANWSETAVGEDELAALEWLLGNTLRTLLGR